MMRINPLATTLYTITNRPKMAKLSHVGLSNNLTTDVVSFSSNRLDKDDAYALRNIPNQTCACCGKGLINEQEFNNLKSKDYEGPAGQVLKKLKPFYKDMRPTTKTVYNLLKRTANKYPMDDLQTLINRRFTYHLCRLELKQLKVLNEAISLNLNLEESSKVELAKTMNKVKHIIFVEPKERAEKRSRIIKEFHVLRNKCKGSEKHKIDKILDVLKALPKSTNDIDSFMIKYAQRGNREIGQCLLAPSLPTLDHIKPKKKSGANNFANMLVLCKDCNNQRGYTPYLEWFQTHPQMPKYIQKNINRVITEINEGRLDNFYSYPKKLKKTLKEVTQNQFVLDISGLNKKLSSHNRIDG